jgi:hypothetical protein
MTKQGLKDEFKITEKRLVAFFDIRGFTDFVYRNDHEIV